MNTTYDNCPYCGRKILKGAMRCVGCGKILKTPEEQTATIKRLKESKKRSDMAGLFKAIIFLLGIGIILYFFSDRIIDFINKFLGK